MAAGIQLADFERRQTAGYVFEHKTVQSRLLLNAIPTLIPECPITVHPLLVHILKEIMEFRTKME